MLQPRSCVNSISALVHGGLDLAELAGKGLAARDILDFSVSLNPFQPPRAICRAVRHATIGQYPDSASTALVRALADQTGLSADMIVAGSGSTELIRAAALAYLDSDDVAVTLDPTYSEYELACRLCGSKLNKFKLKETNGFDFDTQAFIDYAHTHRPKVIFLCNPNNPTGGYIEKDQVEQILSAFPDTLVVIDEAYLAFTQNAWRSEQLLDRPNLLVVRSMTKDFGLAGLRLGYALAHAGIIAALKKALPPWNVNSAAQAAGAAALADDDYLQRQTDRIQTAKTYLWNGFSRLGYRVLPSRTNFFLIYVGNAARFRDALLGRGLLVRDCASFGLPEYIRVAPRSLSDCRRLIKAVREVGAKA